MEPVYTTSATATGGRRDGPLRSARGTLDLAIDPPGHGDWPVKPVPGSP